MPPWARQLDERGLRGARDERDGGALRGRRQGGGEAGEAGADDEEVDPLLFHARVPSASLRPWSENLGDEFSRVRNSASENMDREAPTHVTLAVVLQVRDGRLQVLLWERALEPFAGRWSLPGGYLVPGETLEDSIRRHLAVKVDVRELSHLEQLETLSRAGSPSERVAARDRVPRPRPSRRRPGAPGGHALAPRRGDSRSLRSTTAIVLAGRERLRAKLSYTNVGLRAGAGRVHDLRAPRPLRRRARARGLRDEPAADSRAARTLEPTGGRREPGRAGGRPAALYRFRVRRLEVTDQFAVLRPPGRA